MAHTSLKTDIEAVFAIIKNEFSRHRAPVVDLIELQTRDPFKVLVTTILSSRTKDETTTQASRRLFTEVKTLSDLRTVPVRRLERIIFPVGFYRNKAKFLKALPEAMDRLYGGRIPDTVEELVRLPGVGRKTANLVVAIAFRKPAICVDVHVHRITNRLGYLKTKTPFETEMKLRKILPPHMWLMINSYLVSFGQHTCTPVGPKCSACPVFTHCRRVGVKSTR
jgi:endonuclease III